MHVARSVWAARSQGQCEGGVRTCVAGGCDVHDGGREGCGGGVGGCAVALMLCRSWVAQGGADLCGYMHAEPSVNICMHEADSF